MRNVTTGPAVARQVKSNSLLMQYDIRTLLHERRKLKKKTKNIANNGNKLTTDNWAKSRSNIYDHKETFLYELYAYAS